MEKPTILDIHKVMKSLKMTVFTQPFSITLGGIRTYDNKANTLNDFAFCSYFDDKGNLFSVVEKATVDAGLTYRIKPINKNGTAIIQDGIQHRGVYQYQNPTLNNPKLKKDGKPLQRGHHGHEAFVQVMPMVYWRDNDKNSFIGKSDLMPDFEHLPTEISISATNGHDMGKIGNEVNDWSAGCWGSVELIMDKFYEFAKIQISHSLGDKFSFALLNEKHFSVIL